MADSWRLKLDRANERLEEVRMRIAKITEPDAHDGSVVVQREKGRMPWVYRIRFGVPTDEMLPVVIGEFLYDVRSALDHIAVANVPKPRKSKAQFPIFTEDIWERDAQGIYAERFDQDRRNWETWTRGMRLGVLAVIQECQPYRQALIHGSDAANNALVLLGAFQNADKHRELNLAVTGLFAPTITLPDGTTIPWAGPENAGLKDGAVLIRTEKEVNVKVTGTLKVGLARSPNGAHRELPEVLYSILGEATTVIDMIDAV
jgi:hypothetical protein